MSNREKTIAGSIVTVVTLITMAIVVFLATSEPSESSAGISTAGTNGPLRQIQDWDDLRTKMADHLADWMLQQRAGATGSKGLVGQRRRSFDSMAAPSSRMAKRKARAGAGSVAKTPGPSHHTGTNNQVSGVEEADIIQTDGKFIYTIHGRELLIIRSWPAAQTGIVARHRLDAATRPTEIFVNKDRLVVLSKGYGNAPLPAPSIRRSGRRTSRGWRSHRPNRSTTKTRITVLDIARRSEPRVLQELELQGQLGQTRMIGRKLYLVTTAPMQLPRAVYQAISKMDWSALANNNTWDPARPAAVAVMHSQLSKRIRNSLDRRDIERLLPQAWVVGANGQAGPSRALHRPRDLFVPSTGSQPGLLSLTRLDLDRFELKSTGVMAHGSKVYASAKSFYVAQASRRWWRGRRASQSTLIHKFSLGNGERAPAYAASGTVRGSLLNQFSMDEHKGYLRVATTERSSSRWSGRRRWRRGRRTFTGGGNHIHVLGQKGDRLEVVGSVNGLAKGERIYSARFLGDEGYIVTFRRTDPLFTLDLSDPRRPRVMGELKINGYSSYMHPLSRRSLLTIGQDATSTGRITGVHLQIFDVSDLTNPRRTHHHKLNIGSGRSFSQAQSNHHAFTYDRKSGVLAFPLTLRDHSNPENNFVGLMLVAADPWAGLREIGRIDHGNLGLSQPKQGCIITAGGHCAPRRARTGLRAPKMRRSIIIDGYIYSLSNLGLKVNALRNPNTEVAQVVFARR